MISPNHSFFFFFIVGITIQTLRDMSLKDIIRKIDLLLKENDIMFFSNSEEVINEFRTKIKGKSIRREMLEKFFLLKN